MHQVLKVRVEMRQVWELTIKMHQVRELTVKMHQVRELTVEMHQVRELTVQMQQVWEPSGNVPGVGVVCTDALDLRVHCTNCLLSVPGAGLTHAAERPRAPPVCGGVPGKTARQGLPRRLLHLHEDLPAAICRHYLPSWWQDFAVSLTRQIYCQLTNE